MQPPVSLKNETVILLAKIWVYSGIVENHNLGHASYRQIHRHGPRTKKRTTLTEEGSQVGSLILSKTSTGVNESSHVVGFHWLRGEAEGGSLLLQGSEVAETVWLPSLLWSANFEE